ncbi:DNA cytosine methyltransferase [Oerskovia sp. M15]
MQQREHPDATDQFSGVGGTSTGLHQAGWAIETAANHWPVAVATHQLNHPDTEHRIADLSEFDWRTLPARHAVDLALVRVARPLRWPLACQPGRSSPRLLPQPSASTHVLTSHSSPGPGLRQSRLSGVSRAVSWVLGSSAGVL